MILGSRICALIDGMTINTGSYEVDVKNNHGQQDALDKFIAECDARSVQKFPLVFYVTNKITDLRDRKQCRTSIVIMTNTNPDWLSKSRTAETFEKVIQPIYDKLIPILEKHFLIVDNELDYLDKDNYGIIEGGLASKTSKQSIITDYIDARIINLTLQFDEC